MRQRNTHTILAVCVERLLEDGQPDVEGVVCALGSLESLLLCLELQFGRAICFAHLGDGRFGLLGCLGDDRLALLLGGSHRLVCLGNHLLLGSDRRLLRRDRLIKSGSRRLHLRSIPTILGRLGRSRDFGGGLLNCCCCRGRCLGSRSLRGARLLRRGGHDLSGLLLSCSHCLGACLLGLLQARRRLLGVRLGRLEDARHLIPGLGCLLLLLTYVLDLSRELGCCLLLLLLGRGDALFQRSCLSFRLLRGSLKLAILRICRSRLGGLGCLRFCGRELGASLVDRLLELSELGLCRRLSLCIRLSLRVHLGLGLGFTLGFRRCWRRGEFGRRGSRCGRGLNRGGHRNRLCLGHGLWHLGRLGCGGRLWRDVRLGRGRVLGGRLGRRRRGQLGHWRLLGVLLQLSRSIRVRDPPSPLLGCLLDRWCWSGRALREDFCDDGWR
mmetsp:Transcript_24423/g.30378  ORF Transcript_24423/g.30378 Transcript_24423/m.30378 type:complete len:440 (-) Transcript_24423:299-1618(-)